MVFFHFFFKNHITVFVNLKKKLHLGKNEFNRIFSEMTLSLFFKLAQYTKNALSLKNGKKN